MSAIYGPVKLASFLEAFQAKVSLLRNHHSICIIVYISLPCYVYITFYTVITRSSIYVYI